MFIWDADLTEFIKLTVAIVFFFLFSATMLYLFLFKPEYRDRILNLGKSPFVYYGEGGEGILLLIMPIVFIISCCLLLFILYGWIQVATQ